MALADHVTLNITADSVGVSRPGFGTMGILTYKSLGGPLSKVYTSLSGLTDDSFAVTSPEYLAAAAAFAQTPRPEKIKLLQGTPER